MPPTEGPTTVEFRAAASQFATGITVVTTVLHGVDHAMTVNSFTAVSLEPLLVLICADRSTRFGRIHHDDLHVSQTFQRQRREIHASAVAVDRRIHVGARVAAQVKGSDQKLGLALVSLSRALIVEYDLDLR